MILLYNSTTTCENFFDDAEEELPLEWQLFSKTKKLESRGLIRALNSFIM